jgi:DNA (cytosine-5)-methyltransferase 1
MTYVSLADWDDYLIMLLENSLKTFAAIDLFCGAGGLTLGLKQAGFEVLAAVEIEPIAAETYGLNHPEVHLIQNDIRRIDIKRLKKHLKLKKGDLDLLAGCPPCQGFSSLRTNNKSVSVYDKRNDLLFEFLRFVKELLPKAIMMENVPALAKGKRVLVLLKQLKLLGYKIDENSLRVVDSADFGVPQRRKRMILQSARKGHLAPTSSSKRETVRQCLTEAGLKPVGESGDPLHDFVAKRSAKVDAIIKAIPKNGGSRSSLPTELVLPCHRRNPNGFRDVYGRMKWDDVSPTITGGCGNPSKGRFIHPEEDRAISLREAALLQTFPANYKFSLNRGRDKVALMIGNALPPKFIQHHAIEIAKHIQR